MLQRAYDEKKFTWEGRLTVEAMNMLFERLGEDIRGVWKRADAACELIDLAKGYGQEAL